MRQISKRTWLLIVVGMITALLLLLLDILKETLAGVFSSLPLWIILVSIVVVAGLAVAFGLWQERLKSTPGVPEAVARENRQIMLGRVQTTWITGFLENELYYDELLSLALHARTSRLGSPLQNPLDQAHALPAGTTIKEVFDQARGRLLILGEAGTGKTTLLLELARLAGAPVDRTPADRVLSRVSPTGLAS